MTRRKLVLAAAGAVVIFAAAMTSQIVRRSALTMDEIHTLLLGISWMRGDVLPFYVGSVTRYEGGSWLIAWPVSWLLSMGASGTAATSWTAGVISLVTIALAAVWTARVRQSVAAGVAVGLLAAGVPELVHYSYRAWGSICEALIGFPLLALAYEQWTARGRRMGTAPLLGALLAVCIVLSYVHMVTALAYAAMVFWERGRGPKTRREAVLEVGVVAAAALATFSLWVFLMMPDPLEAALVRDGRSIGSLLGHAMLPRVHLVLGHAPGAYVGQLLDATWLRLLAGTVLTGAVVAGCVAGWRSADPRRRWPIWFLLAFVPGLSVGHALLDPPDVYRYYLPFFACGLVVVALWDLRAVAVAAVASLAFWLPSGLEMPYQNPTLNYLELGGNALHRYHPDPHIKFKALRAHVPEWYRSWFAFGYGVDSGQRYSRARLGMSQTLSRVEDPAAYAASDPHFSLWMVPPWVEFWDTDLGGAADRAEYLLGLGIGFASDARFDERELELLEVLSGDQRAALLEGFGAATLRGLSASPPVDFSGWDDAVRLRLDAGDYEALGRGMAKVAAAGVPDSATLGLAADSPRGSALLRGLDAEWDRARRAMVSVPLIATPERLTDEERE